LACHFTYSHTFKATLLEVHGAQMTLFGRIPTRSMSADEFCPFVPPIWFGREIVQTHVFSELLILTTHHIGASGHAIPYRPAALSHRFYVTTL